MKDGFSIFAKFSGKKKACFSVVYVNFVVWQFCLWQVHLAQMISDCVLSYSVHTGDSHISAKCINHNSRCTAAFAAWFCTYQWSKWQAISFQHIATCYGSIIRICFAFYSTIRDSQQKQWWVICTFFISSMFVLLQVGAKLLLIETNFRGTGLTTRARACWWPLYVLSILVQELQCHSDS